MLFKKSQKNCYFGTKIQKVYETTKPHPAILGHFNYKRELLEKYQRWLS